MRHTLAALLLAQHARALSVQTTVGAVQDAAVRHVKQAIQTKKNMGVLQGAEWGTPAAAARASDRSEAFAVAKRLSEGLLACAACGDGVRSGLIERTCSSAAAAMGDLLAGDASSSADWLRGRAVLAEALLGGGGDDALPGFAAHRAWRAGLDASSPAFEAGDACGAWARAYVVAAEGACPPGARAYLEAAGDDALARGDASTALWTLGMNGYAAAAAGDADFHAASAAAFGAAGGLAALPVDDYPLWLASYVDAAAARAAGARLDPAASGLDPAASADAMLACSVRCAAARGLSGTR